MENVILRKMTFPEDGPSTDVICTTLRGDASKLINQQTDEEEYVSQDDNILRDDAETEIKSMIKAGLLLWIEHHLNL